MHAKKSKRTYAQRGVGITVAAKEIETQIDAANFLDTIEAEVEKLKNEARKHTRKRRADNSGAAQYTGKRKSEPRIPGIMADADGIKDNGMDTQFTREKLVATKKKIKERYALEGPVLKNEFASQDLPFNILKPDHDSGLAKHGFSWLNPTVQRQSVFEVVKAAVAQTKQETGWLDAIYNRYEKYRKLGNIIFEPIESVIDNYFKHKQNLPDVPVYLVAYEVQNFSGLNSALEHDGCDETFDHLMHGVNLFGRRDFASTPAENLANANRQPIVCRPGGKGSIVYALVPARSALDLSLAIGAHIGDAEKYMQNKYSHPETPHANFLRNLENPRHPENLGVRMVTAAVPLHDGSIQSTKEAMRNIRMQLDLNIAQKKLFDGTPIGHDIEIKNNDFIPPPMSTFLYSMANLADSVGKNTARLASRKSHARMRNGSGSGNNGGQSP